jgi:hypothetical protein
MHELHHTLTLVLYHTHTTPQLYCDLGVIDPHYAGRKRPLRLREGQMEKRWQRFSAPLFPTISTMVSAWTARARQVKSVDATVVLMRHEAQCSRNFSRSQNRAKPWRHGVHHREREATSLSSIPTRSQFLLSCLTLSSLTDCICTRPSRYFSWRQLVGQPTLCSITVWTRTVKCHNDAPIMTFFGGTGGSKLPLLLLDPIFSPSLSSDLFHLAVLCVSDSIALPHRFYHSLTAFPIVLP